MNSTAGSSITVNCDDEKQLTRDSDITDSDNNNHIDHVDNDNDTVKLPIILNGDFFKIQSQGPGAKIKARCELCKQKRVDNIISGATNSTTNFRTHLKRLHPEELSGLNNLIQAQNRSRKQRRTEILSATSSNCNNTSKLRQSKVYDVNKNKTKQNRFDENIVSYIVSSMKPLSTVEDPYFRKLCKDLDDRIEVMSRRTLDRKINEEYIYVKSKMKENFKLIKYVSTTADIWSTKHRSFMGVTAHWIDEKTLDRHSAVLACERFKGSHTYDRIAEVLYDINSEYGLGKEKLISTVTDNGSNFVKSFKEFGCNLPSNDDQENIQNEEKYEGMEESNVEDLEFVEIEMGADLEQTSSIHISLPNHIRCASHTLNLLATTDFNKALKGSPASRVHHTALAKCNQLWNLSRKPKSSEIIVEVLGVSLIYPCPTRWNSLYDSISHLLKFRSDLNNLLQKLQLNTSFKDFELEYLSEYCTIMKPIAQALDYLQSEKKYFFGSLMPTLFSLKGRLDMIESHNLRHCKPLLLSLVKSLDKRFTNHYSLSSEVNEAVIAACVHPQFKFKWLPSHLSDVRKSQIQHMCINAAGRCSQSETQSSSSGEDDHFFILTTPTHKERSVTELEFMSFFNDTNKSILSLNNYPEVKKVFIKYNTSLCASAPVERLFSFAGFIHAPARGSISDNMFEMLVFLKGNRNYSKLQQDGGA